LEPEKIEGGSTIMPNTPKHDLVIVELIEDRARLRVKQDFLYPAYHSELGLWLPATRIDVFREREGLYRPAKFQPDPHGYLRIKMKLKVITWHEFNISAHRISYVSERGPTELEVDHYDRIRQNFHGWNLRGVDRLENMQNQTRMFPEYIPEYIEYLEKLEAQVLEARRAAGMPELILPPGAKPVNPF
jgi:hypothetical protein